jgi:hypothetical protein
MSETFGQLINRLKLPDDPADIEPAAPRIARVLLEEPMRIRELVKVLCAAGVVFSDHQERKGMGVLEAQAAGGRLVGAVWKAIVADAMPMPPNAMQ